MGLQLRIPCVDAPHFSMLLIGRLSVVECDLVMYPLVKGLCTIDCPTSGMVCCRREAEVATMEEKQRERKDNLAAFEGKHRNRMESFVVVQSRQTQLQQGENHMRMQGASDFAQRQQTRNQQSQL